MGIIRESFVIYRKWDEAIRKAPEGVQLELYHAIMDFAITGEKPQGLSWEADMLLTSLELQMESNIARYNASVENGKLGGRPKKNADENKNLDEPTQNLEKPIETKKNLDEPTQNLNVNDNVYVNDNVNVNDIKLVNNNKNKFESFDLLHACVRVRERDEVEREPYIEKYKQFFIYHENDKFADAGYELIDTIIEASEQAESEKGLTFKQKHYDKQSFDTVVRKLSTNQFENIVSQLVFNQEIENRPAYIIGCLIENGRNYGINESRTS